ncbi:MAG: short-chain fatty acid transporter, partial [Bacteroidales bacterium]|nr:short-chain fatty acid transporter [Bacteroidales bacterium]
FEKLIRSIFPSAFTLAVVLTILTFILALTATDPVDIKYTADPLYKALTTDPLVTSSNHFIQVLGFWYKGLWDTAMLAFAVQMMLILVLGYVLASTNAFRRIIDKALRFCTNTPRTAFIVTLLTLLVSFFNWGLGLIFGALFARKAMEFGRSQNLSLNYPLIGAAGYSGLMVWHGGISGSAPLKVAEPGHFVTLIGQDLPAVDFSQTIFSEMNLATILVLLIVIPLAMFILGKKHRNNTDSEMPEEIAKNQPARPVLITGAEKVDHIKYAGITLGLAFLAFSFLKGWMTGNMGVIDPNFLNFTLLGLGLVFSGTIANFLTSVKNAMVSASGILIQFPLYFGIMGIMKYSGLVELFSSFLMDISNETTFPIFTFFSAGLVNIFVPSGGGQWAVQGPIIVEAAQNLNIPVGKAVMALAYGDQITNMLQPFWAIPLLGITGLKAREIIPFTLILMIIGLIIFTTMLLIF